MVTERCPLCGGRVASVTFGWHGRQEQVLQCQGCGAEIKAEVELDPEQLRLVCGICGLRAAAPGMTACSTCA